MKYICDVCGYVYDEALGDPDNGIAPGTTSRPRSKRKRNGRPDICRGSFLCGAYSACENLSSSYKVYGIARRNFGGRRIRSVLLRSGMPERDSMCPAQSDPFRRFAQP